MKKDKIYNDLIEKGRNLVQQNGAEYLTARKLSEASGYSVGTIYNQFSNMDNFVIAQNILTLDELAKALNDVKLGSQHYQNLNAYVDTFTDFVLKNKNLWFLLFNFHLSNKGKKTPVEYSRKLIESTRFLNKEFAAQFGFLTTQERKLSTQVLWLSLFALSSLLSTDALDDFSRINKDNVSKLLLNTYLAGISSLGKLNVSFC